MAKNLQSKDEALEAVDFIVNVLKEHEKDLDKLINELATVTEQLGDAGELGGKVGMVEEKITLLQKEITNLVSNTGAVRTMLHPTAIKEEPEQNISTAMLPFVNGPSIILKCKKWEDFQKTANGAQTLSFSYKEEENLFQADAIKGSQLINYSGCPPNFSNLLKAFLSKELGVSQSAIVEGALAIG